MTRIWLARAGALDYEISDPASTKNLTGFELTEITNQGRVTAVKEDTAITSYRPDPGRGRTGCWAGWLIWSRSARADRGGAGCWLETARIWSTRCGRCGAQSSSSRCQSRNRRLFCTISLRNRGANDRKLGPNATPRWYPLRPHPEQLRLINSAARFKLRQQPGVQGRASGPNGR